MVGDSYQSRGNFALAPFGGIGAVMRGEVIDRTVEG